MASLFSCCLGGRKQPAEREVLSSKAPQIKDLTVAAHSANSTSLVPQEDHTQQCGGQAEKQKPACSQELQCTCKAAGGLGPEDGDLRAIIATAPAHQQAIVAAFNLERRARVEPQLLQLLRTWALQLLDSLTQLLADPGEPDITVQERQHRQKVLFDLTALVISTSSNATSSQEAPCLACTARMAALRAVAVKESVQALQQQSASTSLQLACLRCLFKLLRQQEGAAAAVKCNAHLPLIQLLGQTSQPLLVRASLVCVYYLGADDTSLQELLVSHGVVPPLVRLVRDAVDEMLQEAVQVVKMLCKSPVCCEALDAAGMRPLLEIVAAASPEAATVAQSRVALSRLSDAALQLPAQDTPRGTPDLHMSFSRIQVGNSGHVTTESGGINTNGSFRRSSSSRLAATTVCSQGLDTANTHHHVPSNEPTPAASAQPVLDTTGLAPASRGNAAAYAGQCSLGSRQVQPTPLAISTLPPIFSCDNASTSGSNVVSAESVQEVEEPTMADTFTLRPRAASGSSAAAAKPGSMASGSKRLPSQSSGGSMLGTAGSGLISTQALMPAGDSRCEAAPADLPTAAFVSTGGSTGLQSKQTSVSDVLQESQDCDAHTTKPVCVNATPAEAETSARGEFVRPPCTNDATGAAATAVTAAGLAAAVAPSTPTRHSTTLPVLKVAPPSMSQHSSCSNLADALSGPLLLDIAQLQAALDHSGMRDDCGWCADSGALGHVTQYFTAPGSPAQDLPTDSPCSGVMTLSLSMGARTISRELSAGSRLGIPEEETRDVLAAWLPMPPRSRCPRRATLCSVQFASVEVGDCMDQAMRTSRSDSAACEANVTAGISSITDNSMQPTAPRAPVGISAFMPSSAEPSNAAQQQQQEPADKLTDSASPFCRHQLAPPVPSPHMPVVTTVNSVAPRGGRRAAAWVQQLRVDVNMPDTLATDAVHNVLPASSMGKEEASAPVHSTSTAAPPVQMMAREQNNPITAASVITSPVALQQHEECSTACKPAQAAATITAHMISVSSMSEGSSTASPAISTHDEQQHQAKLADCAQLTSPASQCNPVAGTLPTPCYHTTPSISHSALATPVSSPVEHLKQPAVVVGQQQLGAPVQHHQQQLGGLVQQQQGYDLASSSVVYRNPTYGMAVHPMNDDSCSVASGPHARSECSAGSWSPRSSSHSIKSAGVPAYMRATAASAARSHACSAHISPADSFKAMCGVRGNATSSMRAGTSCKLPTIGTTSLGGDTHAVPHHLMWSTGSEPMQPSHSMKMEHVIGHGNIMGSSSSIGSLGSPPARHSGPSTRGHHAASPSQHLLARTSVPSGLTSRHNNNAKRPGSKYSPAPLHHVTQQSTAADQQHVHDTTAKEADCGALRQSPRPGLASFPLPCSKPSRQPPSTDASPTVVVNTTTPSAVVIHPQQALCTTTAAAASMPAAACGQSLSVPVPSIPQQPVKHASTTKAQLISMSQQVNCHGQTLQPCHFPSFATLGLSSAPKQQHQQDGIPLQQQQLTAVQQGFQLDVLAVNSRTQVLSHYPDPNDQKQHQQRAQQDRCQLCPSISTQPAAEQAQSVVLNSNQEQQAPAGCIVGMQHTSSSSSSPSECIPRIGQLLKEASAALGDYLVSPKAFKLDMCEDNATPRLLGEGCSSYVYQGILHGSEPVAIKVTKEKVHSASELQILLSAVQLLKHAPHPNIVQVHGVCIDDGAGAVPTHLTQITELMQGGDLNHALRKHPEFMRWDVLGHKVAEDIALALNHLHCQTPPLIHYDVTSSNVLLTQHGVAKIAAVSMSKCQEADQPIMMPPWTAPEVLAQKEFTTKCCMWSYGLLVWELVTGQNITLHQPLAHSPQMGITGSQLPRMPASAPAVANRIFEACTKEDPDSRPTAAQCVTWLQEACAE